MRFDELVEFTRSLVQCRSFSGEEGPAIQRCVAEMNRLGFDRVWVNGDGSAIGVVEGALPGPTILLDSHCDTVGIAPGSVWTADPFAAAVRDGYLYGRGAADMKGALAAMIHAVAGLDRSRLAGRAVVSVTVQEEVMEGVALKTVMDEVWPDFVIIGESTELNVARGGRGRAEIHLETIGRPSHSSSPQLGLNAVHEMIKVIAATEDLALGSDPLLGRAILALTDMISEPYPGHSVIPSRARATYDRRLLAGETPASVLGPLQGHPALAGISFSAVLDEGRYTTYTGQTLVGTKFFPAWKFEETHPLVGGALRALRSLGLNPALRAYGFCTNAAYSAGIAGVPTIGFGPAAEGDAHVVDERLSLQELQTVAKGYGAIVAEMLCEA
jgi:putative selenium metabolism hydrolase